MRKGRRVAVKMSVDTSESKQDLSALEKETTSSQVAGIVLRKYRGNPKKGKYTGRRNQRVKTKGKDTTAVTRRRRLV